MKEILNKNPKIDLSDFPTIEKSYNYSLRFELGDEIPNGTKKRVRQAKRRALEIFESLFKNEKEIIIISYEWKNEIFARTPNFLFEIIKKNKPKNIEQLALMHFENEEI
ncbi:MAG: hypothetical protein HRT66_01090 [Flavobacteriaceae bacterium]|nr:hypothetical protein [Flavobacteriaceae bacterium]